jgi:outer membrane biosynthesis protein TonB
LLTGRKTRIERKVNISLTIAVVVITPLFLLFAAGSPPGKIAPDKPLILAFQRSEGIQNLPILYQEPETTRTNIPDNVKALRLPQDVRRTISIADPNPDENSKNTDIKHNYSAGTASEKGNGSSGNAVMAKQILKPMQSIPRLIYEELPSGGENKISGQLRLSLKINQDGQVTDHRILVNSIDCTDCLNAILRAAYKSQWEPAMVNGKKAEYWVVKSYKFN